MNEGEPMRLYDTAQQAVVPFTPGPVVSMYTCGITPYDATHLGHAATFMVYDVLQRRLRDRGHDTLCVRNITDVDDPLLAKANQLGIHYLDLAAAEVARFEDDMDALNMLPVYAAPRATSAIGEIRKVIAELIDSGHAYAVDGWVYFDVSTYPAYGQLSHYGQAEMLTLSAERGGDPTDPRKRNPLDFVLWQPSAEGEPAWDSLWGAGRPGWHIECTALARRELQADTLDLHGGGGDLIFPHHECSAAQSECLTGKPLARHWVHASLVWKDGRKMSKSLGNLVFISDLRKEWEARAIRLMLLGERYRHDWAWNEQRMPEANARLERWVEAGDGDGAIDEVRMALDDDLDTPRALAAVDEAVAAGKGVNRAAELLGITL
ncbi:MAG: L-cysteine:1D-myo-inositol 2-amino-2-deoxy-alpha-D-glucopyranoside ligase [Acidimicrobiia bacterium]|jgi:L-cysteine:1D-myo-inositol 2-amino-2-deoxy-alpha-D-glucopyranoside ligase|nr:L-cysteine:1D-myo-inositol 2-amino-2-deoxy-alpha-D-glucopyranoside ligase [Acidimicrobiia bacterium]